MKKLQPTLEPLVDDAGRPPERSCSCCYLFAMSMPRSWKKKKKKKKSESTNSIGIGGFALFLLLP